MPTAIELSSAADGHLDYVERFLSANDLPAEDVREKPGVFRVASVDGDPVGVGGVERHGGAGLLRSVVVEESARGEGYGTTICEALESEARASDVATLYLLTTTARAFFADRGYRVIDREDAPAAIRSTTEFSDLCPASAVCMRKRLRE